LPSRFLRSRSTERRRSAAVGFHIVQLLEKRGAAPKSSSRTLCATFS
jgi:hypothetical protein